MLSFALSSFDAEVFFWSTTTSTIPAAARWQQSCAHCYPISIYSKLHYFFLSMTFQLPLNSFFWTLSTPFWEDTHSAWPCMDEQKAQSAEICLFSFIKRGLGVKVGLISIPSKLRSTWGKQQVTKTSQITMQSKDLQKIVLDKWLNRIYQTEIAKIIRL